MNELRSEIKKAKLIPTDFIDVYSQTKPITNTNGILFDAIKENYYRECPCLNVARMSFIKGNNRLLGNEYVFAVKLLSYIFNLYKLV